MRLEDWLGEDNTIGIDIWKQKYQYNNETFDEWLDRVSGGSEDVRDLIVSKKFLFGGRILANRGTVVEGRKCSYSNCYVISPPEDNIESIFDTAKKLARTYSYGGGCGVDLSKLAPKGATVRNAAKETSGAVSFMDLYSLVTGLIAQNGRRGALMLSLDVGHPDIEEFIRIKTDLDKVTKANISVRISDEFMKAVKYDRDWVLSFTRKETGEVISKTVKAKELFHLMAQVNWDYAEPGMLFWDRIKKWNFLANTESFEFAGTNPCAEEPLPAGGSCLLGSINLSEFVINPFTENARFDFIEFGKAVSISVKALNEVLDEGLPLHPLQEQRDSVNQWRQIGLGIMGLADMLIKLGITYGSGEAVRFCHNIVFDMADTAIATSALLARDSEPFAKCNVKEIMETPYFKANTTPQTAELVQKHGLRNSQLLTIAPTGTLSTMLGVSGGIEPIYANYYERKTESLYGEDKYYKVYTPIVKEYMEANHIEDPSDLPDFFVTAMTLDYKSRIDMQSVWQEYIDASISSTINVPNSFTVEQVEDLYMYAYDKGLKGITIFRDGCKRTGILSTESNNVKPLHRGEVIDVTDNVVGKKRKLVTGCGSLHCVALFDPANGTLLETYLSRGSTGGCNNFMIGLSRMISLSARGGIPIEKIVDQLESTGNCPSYSVRSATKGDTSKGSCCPVAVGNALMDMYNEMQSEIGNTTIIVGNKDKKKDTCPQCGEPLAHEAGCMNCKNCGWSKCE